MKGDKFVLVISYMNNIIPLLRLRDLIMATVQLSQKNI